MSTKQKWDEFFDDLETGDVILMHGLFESSIFIEKLTDCNWSHVAVVVRAGDIDVPGVDDDAVLLWESNIKSADNPGHLEVVDVILKEAKNGPILDMLKQRITVNEKLKDDSDVAKRKLNFQRTPAMFSALEQVIKAVHQDDFPSIPLGEMGHYLEGKLANKPVTDNTYFCSQLAAHTFKAWGLLTDEHVDNWYAPANFAEGSWDVTLEAGATLGPEIRLDKSTIPDPPG